MMEFTMRDSQILNEESKMLLNLAAVMNRKFDLSEVKSITVKRYDLRPLKGWGTTLTVEINGENVNVYTDTGDVETNRINDVIYYFLGLNGADDIASVEVVYNDAMEKVIEEVDNWNK